ncbi:MAG: 4Fe-4S binding protein [Deltaproteobacteria bacterium]|jgi:ferredoxin|nr:4Fe-4S binding protein [Deltaproteobacteria bacterium]
MPNLNEENTVRDIIEIDESLCDGCGKCVIACAEGALALVDGKARLVSDVYCDGLGACLGDCPAGALRIVKRASLDFDEAAAEKRQRAAGESEPEPGALPDKRKEGRVCPGALSMRLIPRPSPERSEPERSEKEKEGAVGLVNWPIQMELVHPKADFLESDAIVVAASCTAFASSSFHSRFLQGGRPLLSFCPKLDDVDLAIIKLKEILKAHPGVRELRVVIMTVPCCRGLIYAAVKAIERSGNMGKVLPRCFNVERDGTIAEELPDRP